MNLEFIKIRRLTHVNRFQEYWKDTARDQIYVRREGLRRGVAWFRLSIYGEIGFENKLEEGRNQYIAKNLTWIELPQ